MSNRSFPFFQTRYSIWLIDDFKLSKSKSVNLTFQSEFLIQKCKSLNTFFEKLKHGSIKINQTEFTSIKNLYSSRNCVEKV